MHFEVILLFYDQADIQQWFFQPPLPSQLLYQRVNEPLLEYFHPVTIFQSEWSS